MPEVWSQSLPLADPVCPGYATLVVVRFDQDEPLGEAFLSPAEQDHRDRLPHPRRRNAWLTGRWAAKRALNLATGHPAAAFTVRPGALGQPVVQGPSGGLQISLAHTEGWAAALVFPETHPMGVDVEEVGPRVRETLAPELARWPLGPWKKAAADEDAAYALVWTSVEAVAKTLKIGLTSGVELLLVEAPRPRNGGWYTGCPLFPQYRVHVGLAHGVALAVSAPVTAHVQVDFPDWQAWRPAP